MSDEKRVRDALTYELEPWQPDTAELMKRGKRLTWLRRGLAAAGVTALAGTVATVSAAVGGPALPVKNLLAGGGKPSVPVVVPTDAPRPSVDPTCLPVPTAKPKLPKVVVNKTIDPNNLPTNKPSVPKPTLPGKPTLPTVPTSKPSLPTTRPSLPG